MGASLSESDSAFLKTLGDLYREMREDAGLTQREAAELAGSRQARVSYLENGKADIQILTLERWANIYGYQIHLSLEPLENDEEEATGV